MRSPYRLLPLVPLLLCAACAGPPTPADPLIERAERVRYAADTTGGGFAPGALRQQIVDTYDEQGLVVFSEYRNADGDVQMQFISTVEDGVRTRTDWRRADGSLALYVLNAYDDQDRVIASRQYAPDSTFRRGFQSRWSDDGLRRETGPIPAEGEPFTPDSFYRLNEQGEELELLEFPDVDSLRTLFTYDYPERDDYGNWTTRRTWRDGTPAQLEIRTLTYRAVE